MNNEIPYKYSMTARVLRYTTVAILDWFSSPLPFLGAAGEVNCDKQLVLCASLDGAAGAWGALKPGGGWQRASRPPPAFLKEAPKASTLHTLSPAEADRILRGGTYSAIWWYSGN